jgi:hypothetical protein
MRVFLAFLSEEQLDWLWFKAPLNGRARGWVRMERERRDA